MRTFVVAAILTALRLHANASASAQTVPANALRVTFLGTGAGPAVTVNRAGPASLVEYGDEVLLIDAGRDDRASENLIAHSQNVDVLVHDMTMFTPAEINAPGATGDRRRAALVLLGTPEQAGTVFARSHCKLAVYSHYLHTPEAVARTRAVYSGPLEAAEDLTQITIGDTIAVATARPNGSA